MPKGIGRMDSTTKQKLQETVNMAVDNKKVFGTSFCIKHNNDTWCGSSGNFENDSSYFIASTTKLFVTAIILQFRSKGILSLDDKIALYLDDSILKDLHTYKGKDYSGEITIRNLLAHTSGIPDYFQQKDPKGRSLELAITGGNDQYWSFEEAIKWTKNIQPFFPPSTKGKAMYSDTNFQLLGKMIKNISRKSLAQNFDEIIFKPCGLTKTYLYEDITDQTPKNLYFKNAELPIPKAMASFKADGGMVSTSGEILKFIEAFFTGTFFPKEYIAELQQWNRIFFPMQSGIGIHRFKLPWLFNPLGSIPDLIGHSGLSGALAYYSPKKNLHITGTVNQVAHPDASFRLAIKLLQKVL